MTSRGNFKLLHGGFEFTNNGTIEGGNTTVWVCSKTRRAYCKGRAHTRRIDGKEMVKLFGIHNHHPDNSVIKKQTFQNYVRYETNVK